MSNRIKGAKQSDAPGIDGPADEALLARISWYYFKEGQTQEAIAQRLSITRKRVNQLLGEARQSGLVQISITGDRGPCYELEAALIVHFGLRQAIVVPSPVTGTDVRPFVGAAAGHFISTQLPPGGSLGISWGGTINSAAHNVRQRSGMNNRVVMLSGGLAESTLINPYDNAAMMARALDATCSYMTAPMYAESKQLKEALLTSEPVKSVIALASKLDMALLSAIDLSEVSKSLEYKVIDRDTWKSLRDAGAVGDICGHYLDRDGKLIQHPLADRVVNPPYLALANIPSLVLAAGGLQKVEIIRAAILAKLCHVLITDETTADTLLTP